MRWYSPSLTRRRVLKILSARKFRVPLIFDESSKGFDNVHNWLTTGNPMPEVTWWQEERMIDRHAEVRHTDQGVRNVLQLERLGRVDLHTKLTCQATNGVGHQLSQPLTKSVQIELNRKSGKHAFHLLLLLLLSFHVDVDYSSVQANYWSGQKTGDFWRRLSGAFCSVPTSKYNKKNKNVRLSWNRCRDKTLNCVTWLVDWQRVTRNRWWHIKVFGGYNLSVRVWPTANWIPSNGTISTGTGCATVHHHHHTRKETNANIRFYRIGISAVMGDKTEAKPFAIDLRYLNCYSLVHFSILSPLSNLLS